MKKRSSIALLTALLAIVFAAGIGVYSNYIGMQIMRKARIICSKAMRKSPRPSRCSCSETGSC